MTWENILKNEFGFDSLVRLSGDLEKKAKELKEKQKEHEMLLEPLPKDEWGQYETPKIPKDEKEKILQHRKERNILLRDTVELSRELLKLATHLRLYRGHRL